MNKEDIKVGTEFTIDPFFYKISQITGETVTLFYKEDLISKYDKTLQCGIGALLTVSIRKIKQREYSDNEIEALDE